MTHPNISSATLGHARMGPRRQLKMALEQYWKGATGLDDLLKVAKEIEALAWDAQIQAGIDRITVGDYYLYDGMLSWAEWLGIAPSRFANMEPGVKRMFAMARGIDGATALSMKKWFTSNYHYMVPEVDATTKVAANLTHFLSDVKRGIEYLGKDRAAAVIIGPVTLVRFVQFKEDGALPLQRMALLDAIIPVYRDLLKELANMGVAEVQIQEPALVLENDHETDMIQLFHQAYPAVFPTDVALPEINMVSFFEAVGETNYKFLINLKDVSIVSLDFTRGDNLSILRHHGFSPDKTLGAGLIDGRSVWKVDPAVTMPIVKDLLSIVEPKRLRIQPSCSLQYVPWDLQCEKEILSHPAGAVLSFAIQKLNEVKQVASIIASGSLEMNDHAEAWTAYRAAVGANEAVQKRLATLTKDDYHRAESFQVRRPKQLLGLPILPTTTIGSFPQTKQVRSFRYKLKKGTLTKDEYNAQIDRQIAYAIGIQEALGLDILVHGEAERTDMVEFFAQQLEGMLFTTNGWVQSFGSRCVRPPILWADIYRPAPMTTREYKVAASLTEKPVKGMLTGPVTILNWSFPRADISRATQATQIALALRDEIEDLEKAGCTVVQVDEPALREAMPLRAADKDEYWKWTVDAFCLATAGASSATQIHTHMCYCEFGDCMDAIDRLDTDVNSIENARSDDATLRAFQEMKYKKCLGPGTYDIHSPVIPPQDFIRGKIDTFLGCMPVEQLVINPDCGLKTRTWEETIGALKNMVAATHAARERLATA